MQRTIAVATILVAFACSVSSFAQGVQSGTIRGTVRDQDRLPVPGVRVMATAPVIQGVLDATTDAEGGYALVNLPPGEYQMTFELSGFTTITRSTNVLLGLTVEQNVSIRPAGVAEAVTVVAETPAPIATPVVGANFKHEEIELLATPRTIQGIAQLAPAVTENTPSSNQVVINGAFAFDNVFMINGVDVNDNLSAQPQNLFVEDAIQETQVLTSGISAEYGRFGGGVVNAITRSGGNSFSGSGRINFVNPSWSTATPFEVSRGIGEAAHPDTLSNTYEGTFGGPLVKDRLWFFASGRYASLDGTVTLQQTGLVLPTNTLNKRAEIKLTGTLSRNHTIQGGYFADPRTRTNASGVQAFVIDPHSEVNDSNPNWYYFTNYHGFAKDKFLIDLQYSERRFHIDDSGGTSTDLHDSPFLSLSCPCLYNAPYFDSTDPESRNNRQVTGAVSTVWIKGGRHETKVGYEFFRSQRTGGGSQSSTSYVFNADFLTNSSGLPVLDSTGRPIPVFEPGNSFIQYYPALRGATLNVDNNSAYVQDHWAINARWSADLGARFEKVKAISTDDVLSVDASRLVPRLAASYDISSSGRHVIHVTYGQYSGRYNEAQIGANSPVGNANEFDSSYQGPAGQGYAFAPAFNLANYPSADFGVVVPLANVFMDESLKSPLTHEFSVSYGVSHLKGRGFSELAYIYRKTNSIVEAFSTRADGTTHVVANGIDAGLVSNVVYRNTDLADRQYQGLAFQTRYSFSNHWSVNGSYTLQLQNDGNYEGEASGMPGVTSRIGDYPEAFNAARNYPDGRLQDFQRHRLRLWSIYNVDMGAAGDASVSGLWRVDSSRVYSLAARNQGLTSTQRGILAAAGYPDGPGPSSVFFGDRGSEEFAGYGVLDMSFNYNVPVFRTLRPWVKFDVYNLFNNQKLIAWNTTISQDPASPKDSLGYSTGYIKGAPFGTATGNTVTNLNLSTINAYPVAFGGALPGGRTLQVALGFRF